MQTEAAAEGRLHSGPAGRVGVVVEGGVSSQRVVQLAGSAESLNSPEQLQHGGVDRGVKKYMQQSMQHSQIGTISQLLAGGIAGAVSKTCTAPLARLTILFQVQGMHSDGATLREASILREASRIVSEEGFRAFWKGNLVTIAHRLPYSSISFYTYERYKTLLQTIPGMERHKENLSLAGGGAAGITAASVTYPLDLVRTRLAAQAYCNRPSSVVSITTFPLDLVRRRMQLEGAAGRARVYKTGLVGTFRHIIQTEGWAGLYRGILPEYYKVVPSVGIVFMTYEIMKILLSQRPSE